MDITTVADTYAVLHDGGEARRVDGLTPDTDHQVDGAAFRTLATPAGALRCTIATVNDVHFGETECGRIDSLPQGPIQRPAAGAAPYPETMSRAAVREITAAGVAAMIVKGDLTRDGDDEEFAAFEACYRGAFGDRLHVVRGNHDSYRGQQRYTGDQWIALPGVSVALMDTAIPEQATGTLRAEQIDWLDAHAAAATDPVIVMGHHQQWVGSQRSDGYFGLHPDASDALADLAARRRSVVAYAAGHTHRHRVRRMRCGVPTIEVGCVKDFPGTWAEYRVYEGGIMQVVHRIGNPDALRWSEQCRGLYADFEIDYASYALGRLEDRCFNIPLR
jgi:3',5'-cyclic-AMP phosphodiesterase